MSEKRKKIADCLGKVLMALSLCFVFVRLYRLKIDFSALREPKIILCLIGLVFMHAANIILASSLCYSECLKIFIDRKIPYVKVIKVYCRSNILKYIPGNVMHFVGRNQLAVDEGVSHAGVAAATLTEMICLLLSAALITLISRRDVIRTFVGEYGVSGKIRFAAIAVCVLAILALACVFVFRKKIKRLTDTLRQKMNSRNAARLSAATGLCAFRLILNGIVFLLCLTVLSGGVDGSLYGSIITLFIVSWVIGFITPGAPGGMGIRETVMCFFLGNLIGESTILYAAVVYRFVTILGDFLACLFQLVLRGSHVNERV